VSLRISKRSDEATGANGSHVRAILQFDAGALRALQPAGPAGAASNSESVDGGGSVPSGSVVAPF
jgi:hypothetical protein